MASVKSIASAARSKRDYSRRKQLSPRSSASRFRQTVNRHADTVRAFEVNAVDYLLKPIRAERLADALERIEHLPNLAQAGPYSHDDQFFFHSDSEMRLVFVTQISGIEAEGN